MRIQAKFFVAITATIGIVLFVLSLRAWHSADYLRFGAYLLIALLASGLKITLPGTDASMSVNFLFTLLGVLELSPAETMIIGCLPTFVQCIRQKNPGPGKATRVVFNVFSMMAPAVWLCSWVYRNSQNILGHSLPLMLMVAASTFFIGNTLPIAAIISLSERRSFRQTWSECHFWSFAYYLAGAALVAVVHYLSRYIGWEAFFLVLPVVYWIYRSYRLYLGRLEDEKRHVEDEKRHVEQVSNLHLRTIEALALAIEAKDQSTHDHLQRVRVYAVEVGKDLGLSSDELEALRAASVLHDIGKLAVPEHIISKPGKLTPEEFDKMKIHPIVGAEILEQVEFPYPVVPIVRAHHEKWDGSGYPSGLKGEEIPIGARILAAVDCLDALASDRQYRRSLPLKDAMACVAAESGRTFDPKVVECLQHRYVELEKLAHERHSKPALKLSTGIKVERGLSPATGFAEPEQSSARREQSRRDYLFYIAAARQESQTLFELSQDLGTSLRLDDTLSMLSVRLKRLVPHDSMAVYLKQDDLLIPEYVNGDNFRLFVSLKIPMGEGLSGWVAQNNKPILNGNPSVEPGYLNDPAKFSTLRSALAVPLEGVSGVVAVLALYRAQQDGFTRDHLRVLQAIGSKLGFTIENALKYRVVEDSATTDYLTGLPNARSLFMHLEHEIARCKRSKLPLGVFVSDLDGFKQVNDKLGHLEGNKLLQIFATVLKEGCREYDYAARMGGDEFVIVVPGLRQDGAPELVERLRKAIAHAANAVCGDQRVSVSVGYAFYPTDSTNAEELLTEADRRMYSAKTSHHATVSHEKPAVGFAKAGKGVEFLSRS
jgi:diguanylate cyclase (GGDEF)-like protein/putative nucleotidyltransferase with HDIG domain